jgi:hypothetical protein
MKADLNVTATGPLTSFNNTLIQFCSLLLMNWASSVPPEVPTLLPSPLAMTKLKLLRISIVRGLMLMSSLSCSNGRRFSSMHELNCLFLSTPAHLRIRIHEVWVRIRIRLLLSSEDSMKNLDYYCFVTSL